MNDEDTQLLDELREQRTKIKQDIKNRANYLLKTIKWIHLNPNWALKKEFYLAGNSLNPGIPNDFDIFPTEPVRVNLGNVMPLPWKQDYDLITKTKNAITIKIQDRSDEDVILQFCNYHYPSLEELVESFDFAHIQVGVRCQVEGPYANAREVYFSNDYVRARLMQSTWFTGSKYPLSSLLRLLKYYKRGDLKHNQAMKAVINIVAEIAQRGFASTSDYRNQLDAVDLGLVPDQFEDLTEGTTPDDLQIQKLFNALFKEGRIRGFEPTVTQIMEDPNHDIDFENVDIGTQRAGFEKVKVDGSDATLIPNPHTPDAIHTSIMREVERKKSEMKAEEDE